MRLSARVKSVTSSPPYLWMPAQTSHTRRVNVINFGGRTRFRHPEHIKIAGIDAIRAGFTKYTPSPGIVELGKLFARN